MSKRLLALLTAVFLAFAAFVAVGCGSDSDSGSGSSGGGSGKTVDVDLQKTFDATKAKGSAEFMAKMTIKTDKETMGLGITGKADFKANKWDLSFDAAKLLASAGVPGSGDGNVRIIVDGKKLYAQIPAIQGLTLPGGAKWIAVDLSKANITSTKPEDSGQQTVKMTEVGTETVDGVSVRHLRAESTLRELLDKVPADQKKQAEEQLEKSADAKKALDEKATIEMWIDNDGALYRLKADTSADDGALSIDIQMSNFGTSVSVSPPPAGETFDGTDLLKGVASQYGVGKTS